MGKFIEIQSSINITVTYGLGGVNHSKPEEEAVQGRDFIKVEPHWQESAVKILRGKHIYPAEIKDWPTVKKMVEAGHFTIGQETDGEGKAETEIKSAETKAAEIEKAMKVSRGKKAIVEAKSELEEAAGE